MAEATLFLGIDGGGTRCRARLVDERGRLLGEGRAGPANIRLGLDAAWSAILGATDQALGQAGLPESAMSRIHAGFGLAGICGPADVEFLLSNNSPFASTEVETDAHTACLGAFAGDDGAILIVGTGSVGYALIGGAAYSVGGWGFEISDDGSGAAIGREAIRAAVRAYDQLSAGGSLTEAVLAKLGPPARIVEWAGSAKPGNYAFFAPLVLEHAQQGDPVANGILRDAAARLDAHVAQLLRLGAPHVCLMGGAATAIEPFLAHASRAALVAPKGDAMDGALLLARRAQARPGEGGG
jgi:glucosamine kinase